MSKKHHRNKFLNKTVKLFNAQDGQCYWCGCYMILGGIPNHDNPFRVTIDHLDPLCHPVRDILLDLQKHGHTPYGYREVAACFTCNNNLGKITQLMINNKIKPKFIVINPYDLSNC